MAVAIVHNRAAAVDVFIAQSLAVGNGRDAADDVRLARFDSLEALLGRRRGKPRPCLCS